MLMDMSQYEGEDRDQVLAGHKILRSLGKKEAHYLIWIAQYFVPIGRGQDLINCASAFEKMTPPEAGCVLAYLSAHFRIQNVARRLNGKSA